MVVFKHIWLSGKVLSWSAIGVSSIILNDNLLIFPKESDSNVTQIFRCSIKWRCATYNIVKKNKYGRTDSVGVKRRSKGLWVLER